MLVSCDTCLVTTVSSRSISVSHTYPRAVAIEPQGDFCHRCWLCVVIETVNYITNHLVGMDPIGWLG